MAHLSMSSDFKYETINNFYSQTFAEQKGIHSVDYLNSCIQSDFNWKYEGVSYGLFKQKYSDQGWRIRKLVAMPKACWAVAKSVSHFAKMILIAPFSHLGETFGSKSHFAIKKERYTAYRDLQEAFGWLILIFSDRIGSYHVQEADFHRFAYQSAIHYRDDMFKDLSFQSFHFTYRRFKDGYHGKRITRRNIPNRARDNEHVIIRNMMLSCGDSIRVASPRIKDIRKNAMLAVMLRAENLKFLPSHFHDDVEVVKLALDSNIKSLKYASERLQKVLQDYKPDPCTEEKIDKFLVENFPDPYFYYSSSWDRDNNRNNNGVLKELLSKEPKPYYYDSEFWDDEESFEYPEEIAREESESAEMAKKIIENAPDLSKGLPAIIQIFMNIDDKDRARQRLCRMLGLNYSVDDDKIDHVYKRVMRQIHPDKWNNPYATHVSQILNSAMRAFNDNDAPLEDRST